MHFRLAPLGVRRDISMLGLIHRTVLKKGPKHFADIFRVSYTLLGRPVVNDARKILRHPVVRRSAFGLAAIYNMLPASFVLSKTVSDFQHKLQELIIARACAGCADWRDTLSPRISLEGHPALSADILEI